MEYNNGLDSSPTAFPPPLVAIIKTIKIMKQIILILLIFLGIDYQLNGQSIIETIEQILEKDSIIYAKLELGFNRNIVVKSKNDQYYVFNIGLKPEPDHIKYSPKKYFIFDQEKNKVYGLEIKIGFENNFNYKFAKFYDSKLILVSEKLTVSNFRIDEFNLIGKKLNTKNGICPRSNPCKCYDATSDFIIWINNGLHILNLERNESNKLAELYLTLGADDNYGNSPQIELDHENRKVLIKHFINKDKRNTGEIKQYSGVPLPYINPIAEYEVVDGVIIFNY